MKKIKRTSCPLERADWSRQWSTHLCNAMHAPTRTNQITAARKMYRRISPMNFGSFFHLLLLASLLARLSSCSRRHFRTMRNSWYSPGYLRVSSSYLSSSAKSSRPPLRALLSSTFCSTSFTPSGSLTFMNARNPARIFLHSLSAPCCAASASSRLLFAAHLSSAARPSARAWLRAARDLASQPG